MPRKATKKKAPLVDALTQTRTQSGIDPSGPMRQSTVQRFTGKEAQGLLQRVQPEEEAIDFGVGRDFKASAREAAAARREGRAIDEQSLGIRKPSAESPFPLGGRPAGSPSWSGIELLPMHDDLNPSDEPQPEGSASPEEGYDPAHAPEAGKGIGFRLVEEADIDRMWDWARKDPDVARSFLGQTYATSRALRGFFDGLAVKVLQGQAALIAIDQDGRHVGFSALSPIRQGSGFVHLYIEPDSRALVHGILTELLGFAARSFPGLQLVVLTDRAELMRLYRPLGFDVKYYLTLQLPRKE